MKTFTRKDRTEVDIRVAQEIKNHQDSVYQISQQIQSLANGLAALTIQHERALAKADSDRKSVLISFENLQEEVLNKLNNFLQRIGDLECKCIHIQIELADKLLDISQIYATKEEHVKSTAFHFDKFKELEDNLKVKSEFFDSTVTSIKNQVNDQVIGLRKEIPSIKEFKPLKKEMEEIFQAFKVDFSGLVKEIALLKKSAAYDQKKFENIYTLIERLKEGVS